MKRKGSLKPNLEKHQCLTNGQRQITWLWGRGRESVVGRESQKPREKAVLTCVEDDGKAESAISEGPPLASWKLVLLGPLKMSGSAEEWGRSGRDERH